MVNKLLRQDMCVFICIYTYIYIHECQHDKDHLITPGQGSWVSEWGDGSCVCFTPKKLLRRTDRQWYQSVRFCCFGLSMLQAWKVSCSWLLGFNQLRGLHNTILPSLHSFFLKSKTVPHALTYTQKFEDFKQQIFCHYPW